MKKFLTRSGLFFFILFVFISVTIYFVNYAIDRGNYFSLDKNITSIVVGHSHPECAFDDSLIQGFKNLAQSGESYFYTYQKLKKIIDNNVQVKNVFIEFTNNQITKKMDDWTWGDAYISEKIPKYAALLQVNDFISLILHNPGALLNSMSVTLKNNLIFLLKRKSNYIDENDWGHYLKLNRVLIQNEFDTATSDRIKYNTSNKEVSVNNLKYLHEMVQLCRSRGINVFFIRSPLHPHYSGIVNEGLYKMILAKKFADVELLDFKNFPLNNEEYADLEHLNYLGATKFSSFFNQLIKGGLLQNDNKEKMILEAFPKAKNYDSLSNATF